VTPAPPAVDTATAESEDATHDLEPLIGRGDELRATGDFAAARRFYELAAEQGSAAAARAVGETYDPVVLEEAHVLGVRGDVLVAANWYRKAIDGGDVEAAQLLLRLMTKPAK
jgi:TPR repeat protein